MNSKQPLYLYSISISISTLYLYLYLKTMTKPRLEWDIGTAYDMLVSLHVLHDPNKYGLRGSWAAGVRSRLPNPEREILQQLMDISFWGLHWIYTLTGEKNGRFLLNTLQQMPPQNASPPSALPPTCRQRCSPTYTRWPHGAATPMPT
jgi:hypothetical protein